MVRRSSIVVALVASFILAGSDNLISAQSIAAGQRVVLDALAQITGRSPGDRTGATLTKIKGESAAPRNAHALARTRTKPKAQNPMAPPVKPSDDELAAFHPVPLFAAAAVPELSNGSALGPGFGSFPSFPGGGGGGIIGGGGGGEGPPNGTEPAPAVPEPATWTTLILGFGLVGAFLRRRRQRSEPKLG